MRNVTLLLLAALCCALWARGAGAKQFHAYVRQPAQVPPNVTNAMSGASVESFDEGDAGALYVFDAASAHAVHDMLAEWYGVQPNQTVEQRTRSVTELGGAQFFVAEVRTVSARYAAQSWGLDRVDQRARPLDGQYSPETGNDGTGVTAWVVDTGIDATHIEFVGPGATVRAQNVYAAYSPSYDCDGHGTHVAGTIGGLNYGIARNVQLRGIKVLNCAGSGTTYTVAQGLLYVLAHLTGADVVNLSLGYGARDSAIEAIIVDLMAARVVVVAAAGNTANDACGHFPSAQVGVISVASTDSIDQRSSFSNFGPCVNLFAPGSLITSARMGGGSIVMSGTSMATPHVAGAAALILQNNLLYTTSQTWAAILARATVGVITNEMGSPDLLLYVRDPPAPGSASVTPTQTRAPASATPTRTRAPQASPSRTPTRTRAPATPSRTGTKAPRPPTPSRTGTKAPRPPTPSRTGTKAPRPPTPSRTGTKAPRPPTPSRTPSRTKRPRSRSDAPSSTGSVDSGTGPFSWSALCVLVVVALAAFA